MKVKREAGPHETWPKMLKGELENNADSQGTRSENWHHDSLKRFNLLFLSLRRRREMMLMMKMMMIW
jgi:hypothetical protein